MATLTSNIIENVPARQNQRRVTFTHADDLGKVYGPFVEHRLANDDIAAFVEGHRQSMIACLQQAEIEANTQEVLGA